MSDARLYEQLRKQAARRAARFHMPGHKGRPVLPELNFPFPIDYTEIEGTGKNTLTLLDKADELANRYERYGKHFSHVWIVFDKDDFPPDNLSLLNIFCKSP